MRFELTIAVIFLLGISSTTSSNSTEFLAGFQTFNKNIFSEILKLNDAENCIFSPFSIRTCLAMIRMGAAGPTADELDQGLVFTGQKPESIADNYSSLLAKYEKSDILKIANKVYVTNGHELQDNFKELLSKKFFSSAENIDFGETVQATNAINAWVESQTNNKIKNFLPPDALDLDTNMVLLNAVYFNGKWEKAFDKKDTSESDFFINDSDSVKVQMMYKTGKCESHHVTELGARVLRLPYKDSDLTMLVMLPRNRTGLPELESGLKNFSFDTLGRKIANPKCVIRLPKFKTEFEIELKSTLRKIGISQIFSDGANFSKMLKSDGTLHIDRVIHKAVIEITEEGTEAAAATGNSGGRIAPYAFDANHPFVYAIVNEDNVPLFQGVFVKP